ncbi:MAG: FIST N-terminal domain-containing protein [Actinomycetota bacterium]
MSTIKIGAGLSTNIDVTTALGEALFGATATFGDEIPNLVVCFISEEHRDSADEVAAALGWRFPAAAVIGSTAAGVIGGPEEVEHGPAVSVLTAFLPDTRVFPFGLRFNEDPDGKHTYTGWPEPLVPDATLLMFCDRFSLPAGHLVEHLNQTRPGQVVVGGLTSGGQEPGDTRLFYGGRVFDDGAVGVAVEGRVRLRPLVSQGCRPIGAPMTITRADRNIIFELAGERPIDVIKALWQRADSTDRALMQHGLQLGRVVDEYRSEFGYGDFVIRPVMGADPQEGIIAVGDVVTIGETVQFHVRDPHSADEDLGKALAAVAEPPHGALLFSCTGRGRAMFQESDHDAIQVTEALNAPLAGMFCAGELGPVGGRNFLHGLTASLALFEDTGA